MSIETTVVIDFGEAVDKEDYLALIELDDISNNNTTSFGPGSQPVIGAHFSNNIVINEIVPTDGSIIPLGVASRSNVSSTSFISRIPGNEDTYRLPVIPTSVSTEYKGRSGITSENTETVGGIVEYIGDVTATPFIAEYTCTYSTRLYKLIPPPLILDPKETYDILIVFYLTLVT